MEGPVKLAFAEIPTSDNGFDISGFGIEAEQGALDERFLFKDEERRLVLFGGSSFTLT